MSPHSTMKHKSILFGTITLFAVLSACSGFRRTMPSYPRPAQEPTSVEAEDYSRAINDFYRAENAEKAEHALERAEKLAPDAAGTHEIRARLALMKGEEDSAWRHFYLALATAGNPAGMLHLRDLLATPMTTSQYMETLALLEEIVDRSPDQHLRRVAAAFVASWRRRLQADVSGAEEALSRRGAVQHFAVASAFDNEDGQGFQVAYPPEREIDYKKEYKGTELPARWRVGVPLDHQRGIDFGALVSPDSHVAAYALTHLRLPEESSYLLRVTTTDALKIWVNDIMVLAEKRVDDDSEDQFQVPVVLRAGWNKVLVKSCHERGPWRLELSVSEPDGALVRGLESSAEIKEPAQGSPPGEVYDFDKDLDGRLTGIHEPARRMFYAVQLAELAGLEASTLDRSEEFLAAEPSSLISRLEAALVAWNAGQKGRTIDTLDALIHENQDRVPQLFVFRSDYFAEQDRDARMLGDLEAAIEANPKYRSARLKLAEHYAGEGWSEDHLKARLDDAREWPDDPRTLWGLASAYEDLGRFEDAREVYLKIMNGWPGASDILNKMADLELKSNDYHEAIHYQEKLIKLFDTNPDFHLDLGDIYRRSGKIDRAEAEYRRCLEIDDRWSTPIIRLGAMAHENGDLEKALDLWQKALELDPDNHSLANRLDYLSPRDDGILEAFAPTEEEIRRVLTSSREVKVLPGSDLIYLLDHAVEQVELDGSSRQIVTQIAMVVNDTGRDKLTKYDFPPGRLRIMEAYAVDADGTRREASSVRGHSARFRELTIGSTVVIQFRLDIYPGGYLSRHLSRRWYFHAPGAQFEDSHYVLVVPQGMEIHEYGRGRWRRKDRSVEDRRVIEYRAKSVPPLVPEPNSPPFSDLLDQVVLSSIPDWDTIAGWDQALLVDVFHTSRETRELSRALTRRARTKREKLDAITRFVMREVRYQQDYESSIAGVKPHSASVVLQRAYGDCKDKSVLLMTLAREVGIDTRFALLRTTGQGAFIKELPSLQFNHAIVYVPEQEGLDKPFFIDSTPNTLDLKTLRPDSQNTWAMVINPEAEKWEFIKTPMEPANQHYTLRRTRIFPVVDGSSTVDLTLTMQGPAAAAVRAVLRNMDDSKVFASGLVGTLFPGAQLKDFSFSGEADIVEPLTLTIELTSDGILRNQGDDVVIELPKSENLSRYIGLTERKLPLRTGTFLSLVELEDEVAIPPGYSVVHAPDEVDIANRFFDFTRGVEISDGSLEVKVKFVEKTLEISADEYPEYRAAVKQVLDALEQDLIFRPKKAKKRGRKK